ncbi:hypothetical protein [uncultured Phenylobacterium sp.]|uniref:hypothetical protein n=1 Tax=uncultured Phenylobacterium sp. TaxID=349273 RepID=UPI0025ED7351|nr:hypothetical protein [uncultured Phenylobacterium sp.]
MFTFYHLSDTVHAVGAVLTPRGYPRVTGAAIEERLERFRPPDCLARNKAVYLSPSPEFKGYGLTRGYIYTVLAADPEFHDTAWLTSMQKNAFLDKHGDLMTKRWGYASEQQLDDDCLRYWSGIAALESSMEALVREATIIDVSADLMDVRSMESRFTSGSWDAG